MEQQVEILDPVKQVHEIDGLSNQYKFIDSKEVIDVAGELGWKIHSIQRSRAKDRMLGYQNHLIDFRNPDVKFSESTHDFLTARMLYFGSHNGKSANKLMAGIFNLICSNGLIIGTKFFSCKVIHKGQNAIDFNSNVKEIASKFNVLGGVVESMRKNTMTQRQIESYLTKADQLKFPHDEGTYFDKRSLLTVKRKEDASNSVWDIYNRIQESIFTGGFKGIRFEDGVPQFFQTRKINNMKDKIRINTGLFEAAFEINSQHTGG